MLNRLKEGKRKTQDRELFELLQNGDLNSFRSIYIRFWKPILRYVLKRVKSIHLAEEVTQDIFLKIYQFRHSYNFDYDVSTWIWTIARNTVFDHMREVRTKPVEVEETTPYFFKSRFEPFSVETAETLMIEKLETVNILDLMSKLSGKQREALLLRVEKKFSYLEISRSMNLSLSAVKSLISRGKSTLIKQAMPETQK